MAPHLKKSGHRRKNDTVRNCGKSIGLISFSLLWNQRFRRLAAPRKEGLALKQILCFGDSNTYGFIPGSEGRRYGPDVRWTGRLGTLLGPEYHIVEEGLSGRTTVFDDPILPGRNGGDYLYPCLHSHAPLDLLLIMLGTNDCKMRFGASAQNIAAGMAALVRMALTAPVWRERPRVLVAAPPAMTPQCFAEAAGAESGRLCADKSRLLAPLYQKIADQPGCSFFDAGSCAAVSALDGTHLEEMSHCALAHGLALFIQQLFSESEEPL